MNKYIHKYVFNISSFGRYTTKYYKNVFGCRSALFILNNRTGTFFRKIIKNKLKLII